MLFRSNVAEAGPLLCGGMTVFNPLAMYAKPTSRVGIVGIGGLQSPSIHVQVNPAQLAAAGLDLEDVRTALTNATVNQPKGQLYGNQTAYALQTNDQLMSASGFDEDRLPG